MAAPAAAAAAGAATSGAGAGAGGGAAGAGAGGAGGAGGGAPSGLRMPRPRVQGPRTRSGFERLAQAMLAFLGFFLSILLLILIPVVAIVALPDLFLPSTASAGAPGVPREFLPMYLAAADEYHVNPFLLASIHKHETEFGTFDATGVQDGYNECGAAGPMQFGVVGVPPYNAPFNETCSAGPTWQSYWKASDPIESSRPDVYPLQRSELSACKPVPKDVGCVYDSFDAIAAAAAKLQHDGANADLGSPETHNAVLAYNASEEYALNVISQAKAWAAYEQPTPIDLEEAVRTTPPRSLARVKAVAEAIDQFTESGGLSYCWGGGHGPQPGPSGGDYCWHGDQKVYGSSRLGLDCSGAVRFLLTESGFSDPGGISSGYFGGFLESGTGRDFSIYYRGGATGHVYAIIDGETWQTSDSNTNHGPGWTDSQSSVSYAAGHVEGM